MTLVERELAVLEQELLHAGDIWFSAPLHKKLQRLIEIAKLGQVAMKELADLRHIQAEPFFDGETLTGRADG